MNLYLCHFIDEMKTNYLVYLEVHIDYSTVFDAHACLLLC